MGKKRAKPIIEIRKDEVTVEQVEIEKSFIDFYKKETGRSRVTKRGLSKFLNHLLELFEH
jgi:hypothetical protein